MKKARLMTPGPVDVPAETLLAMAQPLFHHRTAQFRALLGETLGLLKQVFRTKNDVILFTASGTGAMEAAVANVLAPGEKALFVSGGKFGERWGEIAQAFGHETVEVSVPYGKAVDPEEIRKALAADPTIGAVYTTLCETSTGVVHDIEAIGKIVKGTNALLVVDGISAVGAVPMETDAWAVDLLAVGSQKALMIPPGLALLTVSDKAWAKVDQVQAPAYYFGLGAAKKSLAKCDTPYTPAITLVIGLKKSLDLIIEEGVENVWQRHRTLADAVRAGVQALGLELFAESPSDSITAVKVPDGVDGEQIPKNMADDYGVRIAGGQASVKGKIFRIGHMGYVDKIDVIGTLGALEMTLAERGMQIDHGAAVKAAEQVFLAI